MPLAASGPASRFDAKPGTAEFYVWALIRAADRMRDHWAEAPAGSPYRNELWRDLHTASDAAGIALEEGPEAAAAYMGAARQMRERERRTAKTSLG
jgi:hypothetical protein